MTGPVPWPIPSTSGLPSPSMSATVTPPYMNRSPSSTGSTWTFTGCHAVPSNRKTRKVPPARRGGGVTISGEPSPSRSATSMLERQKPPVGRPSDFSSNLRRVREVFGVTTSYSPGGTSTIGSRPSGAFSVSLFRAAAASSGAST